MDPLTRTLSPIHHTAKTTSGDLHYWEYNADKTPTIVVIHGYRGTHHGLERIIAHMPEMRFIVPDLPGFGESPALDNKPHTIENYAATIASFMRKQNLAGSIVLGHSMGSIVAAELAATHPELVPALILINPIAADPRSGLNGMIVRPAIVYQWLGGKLLPVRLGKKFLDSKLFLLAGSVLMAKTRDKSLRKIIHTSHLTHMTEYASPAMLYEAYLASLGGTVRDRAPHITMPTLMIAGDRDELAPPISQHALLAELEQAQLVMIDNVGHLIHYEKPAEAAGAIREFLTQQAGRKSQ